MSCSDHYKGEQPAGLTAAGALHHRQMQTAVKNMTEQEMRTWRKQRPVYSGVLSYFPDALLEVAHCSWKGNEQHNPGEPLHWAKEKSQDEPDALVRHMLDRARGEVRDSDGVRHLAKAAWRALANLQREIEGERPAETKAPAKVEMFTCPLDGEKDCCSRNSYEKCLSVKGLKS